MPALQQVNEAWKPGDIFIRGIEVHPFFLSEKIVTSTGVGPTYWPSGTPIVLSTGDAAANSNGSSNAILYNPAVLLPGNPTKLCVVNSLYATGHPGFFNGLKINVTRLPLGGTNSGLRNLAGSATRAYTLAQWKTALDRMGIAWFEESTRALEQPK